MPNDPNRKRKSKKPRLPAPQKSKSRPRKNTKVTGERSEAAFLDRAIQRNFGVAKPWGDSRRYDFILDNGERLIRIQVKCTESIRARAYETRATYTVGNQRAVYTKKDIDFIAAHVVPLDLWYIIPVEICTPAPMLRFYPHRKAKKMRLEPYREAWYHILPTENVDKNGRIDLQASADPDYDDTFYSEEEADVGTAALGCPVEQSSTATPAENHDSTHPNSQLHRYRTLQTQTPAITLNPRLAPWPLPPAKILATRKGANLLPTQQKS